MERNCLLDCRPFAVASGVLRSLPMDDRICEAENDRMTLSEWAESFAILAKYDPECNDVYAEHDELSAGPDNSFADMD
ncbi:MAG: hypothetical protein ABIH03_08285, partial [Pseudomonadota bacterium]